MKTSTTLSVLVPAYNEQYLVEASLERLQASSAESISSSPVEAYAHPS